ncbi:hypothetical protein A9404_04895 [Halothiobacillus diazotrophicus]|uniref:cyclic-guanylate-specific phosphodiesterase n=1 Tax=Halothiobacillus diazotrophicus TaxID=1860122 RepID=A0A191ZFZ0_9GAMM|nr:EAL domain-containing protein [Halothiobacillus diazotrophicus]ANJ66799.1 hypothetical protein A9404_04895 [Halothiobacillus diazotrophicus]
MRTYSGIAAFLLGAIAILGWLTGYAPLIHIQPGWKPMVPATALSFMLSGLLIGIRRSSTTYDNRSRWLENLLASVVFLLIGIRGLALLGGMETDATQTPLWTWLYENQGQMSAPTVWGFLIFLAGYLLARRARSKHAVLAAQILSGLLIGGGLVFVFAYTINLQQLFESEFFTFGLVWLSMPTAIGLLLLGLGVWDIARQRTQPKVSITNVEAQAGQIYRATVVVITLTALATGTLGIVFLEETALNQSKTDMAQTLQTKQSHLSSLIQNHVERALLASTDPTLMTSVQSLLQNIRHRIPVTVQSQITDRLILHGFTGVALQAGDQTKIIVGKLLPESVRAFPLKSTPDGYLLWDRNYYLRMRIPVADENRSTRVGYLIIEQVMPRVGKLIDDANHWGDTGTLPMCGRLNAHQLICYPQREQSDIYIVPDHINGTPIPMNYALAGKHEVAIRTDYRGRHVLAAYGPVDHSGLGLVLKMDLSEVYDPVKRELLLLLPLIVILALIGLGLIQLRARPLLADLARSHAAESEARSRFEAAMDSSPDIFIIYDAIRDESGEVTDFRASFTNKNAATNTRLSERNLTGHSCIELFPEQKGLLESYRTVLRTGKPLINECTWTDDQGQAHWYQRQVVAMPSGVAATFRNITEEKRLFEELDYANRLRTAIVESAAYSIISTDVHGTILSFNKAAERMLWYRAEEMIGKCTPGVFHDPEEVKERAESLSQELGHPIEPGFEVFVAKPKIQAVEEREWTYVRKDGSRFPVQLSVTALRGPKHEIHGFLGIAYDISEQKRADEYIRHIALHDALTGLPNRVLLEDRVAMAIEQQRRKNTPLALAMMDIDRFKHINDSMGHHIGDKVLKEFVSRVQSCLRQTDTLARMGGDEFVLLLNDTDETGAEQVADRIKKALIAPVDVGLQEIHITSSIGISRCPNDARDINELLRCADVAMYWVKAHGRNGHKLFSRDMDLGASERLNLERDLHRALDQGEFELFYQPKVAFETQTIIGVEALLRLRKTDNQFISPANFIPLAEETGLIVPIGQWALEAACRDAALLHRKLGVPLTMAVNISPRQFVNDNLILQIQEALKHAGLSARHLELEITEGVLMNDRNGVEHTLNALRNLGVRISIDDFGTGYSSLSYLKRFPISQIKIDQSFVHDITSDPEDAALVEAIVAMGHSLRIPVIAEGIETSEQLDHLARLECDEGQGYFIARPMPLDALLAWVNKENTWRLSNASPIG